MQHSWAVFLVVLAAIFGVLNYTFSKHANWPRHITIIANALTIALAVYLFLYRGFFNQALEDEIAASVVKKICHSYSFGWCEPALGLSAEQIELALRNSDDSKLLLSIRKLYPATKNAVERRISVLGYVRIPTIIGEVWRRAGDREPFKLCESLGCPEMVLVPAFGAEVPTRETHDDLSAKGESMRLDISGDWGLRLRGCRLTTKRTGARLGVVLTTNERKVIVGLAPNEGAAREREAVEIASDGQEHTDLDVGSLVVVKPVNLSNVRGEWEIIERPEALFAPAVCHELRVPKLPAFAVSTKPISSDQIAAALGEKKWLTRSCEVTLPDFVAIRNDMQTTQRCISPRLALRYIDVLNTISGARLKLMNKDQLLASELFLSEVPRLYVVRKSGDLLSSERFAVDMFLIDDCESKSASDRCDMFFVAGLTAADVTAKTNDAILFKVGATSEMNGLQFRVVWPIE